MGCYGDACNDVIKHWFDKQHLYVWKWCTSVSIRTLPAHGINSVTPSLPPNCKLSLLCNKLHIMHEHHQSGCINLLGVITPLFASPRTYNTQSIAAVSGRSINVSVLLPGTSSQQCRLKLVPTQTATAEQTPADSDPLTSAQFKLLIPPPHHFLMSLFLRKPLMHIPGFP